MSLLRIGALIPALALGASSFAGTLAISGMVPGKHRMVDVAVYGDPRYLDVGPQAANYDGRDFEGYCIDLAYTQQVPSSFDAAPVAASGFLVNGDRIARLVNQYSATVTDSFRGAALQLAIWDVLIDGGDGAAAGDFQASNLNSATFSAFEAMLADPLTGVSNVATVYDPQSHGAGNNVNQGLIEAVPEPASLAVLGLGVWGLVRRKRNRNR